MVTPGACGPVRADRCPRLYGLQAAERSLVRCVRSNSMIGS